MTDQPDPKHPATPKPTRRPRRRSTQAKGARKRKAKAPAFELQQDPTNANQGTARGRKMLAESLERYGAGRSILTDKNGRILAGNKTAAAAQQAGIPIRVVETTGDELVVVQRTDLDAEQDAGARELAYADNRIAQVDLHWNRAQLGAEFKAASAEALKAFWTPAEQASLRGEPLPKPSDRPAAGTKAVATEIVLRFDPAQAERWAAWMRVLERRYPETATIAERIDAAIGAWEPPA